MISSLKTFYKIFWGNKWNIWAKKTLNCSLKNPLTLFAKAVFKSGSFSSSENMENIMYRYLFRWKDIFILKIPKIYSLQESVLKLHWFFWFCFVSGWHQQWLNSYQPHTGQGMFSTADPAGRTTIIHNSPFQQSYSVLQLQTWPVVPTPGHFMLWFVASPQQKAPLISLGPSSPVALEPPVPPVRFSLWISDTHLPTLNWFPGRMEATDSLWHWPPPRCHKLCHLSRMGVCQQEQEAQDAACIPPLKIKYISFKCESQLTNANKFLLPHECFQNAVLN